jgi:hypothetical protein
MTLQEVCMKLDLSESSVKTNFARTQKILLRKNIKLIKKGRGAAATYEIEYLNDNRAMTIYEELKEDIILSNESIEFPNWEFLVFLAIVTTPMIVFRGSYKEFLQYVQMKDSENNLKNLKEALEGLASRDIIVYMIDKTDENYFIATIYRKIEEDMKIGIDMVKECKRLQEKYHKQSFIPLLKTWLGVQILVENQPFVIRDIVNITGLSEYAVKESHKILKESEIYKASRAFKTINCCVGVSAELNGFYNT